MPPLDRKGRCRTYPRSAAGLLPSMIRRTAYTPSSTSSNTARAQVEVKVRATTGGTSRVGTAGTTTESGSRDYDGDFQLLYGRFIQKYYDFQIGPRVETQTFRGRNVTRGLGVIGIEGLVPYNYEFESALFIDQNGAVSARLSLTKDMLLTQRLIFQARFETNAAIQRVEEFTTGSGLNNLEFGARLRYEIRREFAPYVGVSLDRSFGETATLVRREGGDPSQVRFVVGVRAWF